METYVIRLWTPAEAQSAPAGRILRGEVQRVATGTATTFVGIEQLIEFLTGPPDPEDGRVSVDLSR